MKRIYVIFCVFIIGVMLIVARISNTVGSRYDNYKLCQKKCYNNCIEKYELNSKVNACMKICDVDCEF